MKALVKNSYIPGFRKIASKEKELQEAKVPFQRSKKIRGCRMAVRTS